MIQLTTDTTTMSVDDGLVLLDGRRGKYWQLNASASSTLSMLLDGKTIDDVVADLTRITDAPAERVRRDTEELLSGLLAARLVELSLMTIPLAPENTVDLRPVEQLRARTAVAIARLLIILPPARLARLLTRVCRRSRPATYDEALAARTAACSVSIRCAGLGCLQRSVATVLICRMRGASPDWCTGFRTQPFAAHAWVEVDGQAVGEPDGIRNFLTMIAVRHESGNRS